MQEIREREREILRVARAMFLEEGYFGLTMGKIAKRICWRRAFIWGAEPQRIAD